MPTLGNSLDFAKFEGRNFRGHQLGAAPSSPVTGQLYYNTADNTLYWWDGSAWVSARGGASATPPSTTSSLGTIQLAGDLAGTATSPQIAAGVITDADVNVNNKDGVVGTASMRTLGAGAQQAMPGNRTLDAISAPLASVNFNSQRATSMLDPQFAQDGATKQYVDNTVQGLDAKASVKSATTTNITLTGLLTIDGSSTAVGERILVKDQTNAAQNGIYIVAVGAWTRAPDMNTWEEVPKAYVWVEQGGINPNTGWVCTATQAGSLDTTAIPWTQFSGAGMIAAGAGLTKTGNQLDIGAGAGITINADSIQVANNGITQAMIADNAIDLNGNDVMNTLPVNKGGTGSIDADDARMSLSAAGYYSVNAHAAGTTIVITSATHLLRASRGLYVQVQDTTTGVVEIPDVAVSGTGDVTITFGASVAANSKRITVIG